MENEAAEFEIFRSAQATPRPSTPFPLSFASFRSTPLSALPSHPLSPIRSQESSVSPTKPVINYVNMAPTSSLSGDRVESVPIQTEVKPPISSAPRPPTQSAGGIRQQKYPVDTRLCQILETLPFMPQGETNYTITEVTYAFEQYLRFFFPPHPPHVIDFYDCRKDPLRFVLGVEYFHRMELPQILWDKIVPVKARNPANTLLETLHITYCLQEARDTLAPFPAPHILPASSIYDVPKKSIVPTMVTQPHLIGCSHCKSEKFSTVIKIPNGHQYICNQCKKVTTLINVP
jgi:hypothetical protein